MSHTSAFLLPLPPLPMPSPPPQHGRRSPLSVNKSRIAVAAVLALLCCVDPGASRAADAPDSGTQDPATGADPAVRIPDGVQASPTSSVLVTHPDPQCPGAGSFRRNSITYTEWANNKVVSTWTNTTETFQACVDADPSAPETPPP